MNVNIYFDVSYCPNSKTAGYAFWIICNNRNLKVSGIFRQFPASYKECEAMAIANALHYLKANESLSIYILYINTYSSNIKESLKKDSVIKAGEKAYFMAMDMLRDSPVKGHYSTRCRKRLKISEIEPHVTINDFKSRIMDWCKETAMDQMRKARKNLKN